MYREYRETWVAGESIEIPVSYRSTHTHSHVRFKVIILHAVSMYRENVLSLAYHTQTLPSHFILLNAQLL